MTREAWTDVLLMQNEYSPERKTTCLLLLLFVNICKSAFSILLFVVALSWFSVLWIVTVILEVCKKSATACDRMRPTFYSPKYV